MTHPRTTYGLHEPQGLGEDCCLTYRGGCTFSSGLSQESGFRIQDSGVYGRPLSARSCLWGCFSGTRSSERVVRLDKMKALSGFKNRGRVRVRGRRWERLRQRRAARLSFAAMTRAFPDGGSRSHSFFAANRPRPRTSNSSSIPIVEFLLRSSRGHPAMCS
jgi:hypothetical protein